MSPEEWAFKISELIKEAEADGMSVMPDNFFGEAVLLVWANPGPAASMEEHVECRKQAIKVDW